MELDQKNLTAKFQVILECAKAGKIELKAGNKPLKDINNQSEIEKIKEKFIQGRSRKHPEAPKTVTDKAYLDVMRYYFDCLETYETIEDLHKKAMGSENIVGDILERYLAFKLEPSGWVWVSGSVAKAVDFVYRWNDGSWVLLQVKNRDNSENSSSSKIRENTEIVKWFRTFSRTADTNWKNFPYLPTGVELSEDEFRQFLIKYVKTLKEEIKRR